MNTRKFSEALGGIDDKYIEKALSYQPKRSSASHGKRGMLLLAAALITVLLMGSAVAVAVLHGDLWLQRPSNDPAESVRSALENQAGKDYTLKIEVKSVEIDEAETERVLERFIKGTIADWRGWSDEYLAEHFVVVKAVYDAEYDHAQTTRSDGEVIMYFYLTQDVDSGAWTIVDNSGNVNWSENDPPDESGDPAVESTEPAARSTEEQIFSYLSELFPKHIPPIMTACTTKSMTMRRPPTETASRPPSSGRTTGSARDGILGRTKGSNSWRTGPSRSRPQSGRTVHLILRQSQSL